MSKINSALGCPVALGPPEKAGLGTYGINACGSEVGYSRLPLIVTHADGSGEGIGLSPVFMCLSVFLHNM